MKIISVVGARPNFMKIAPFIMAIKNFNNSIPYSVETKGGKIEHILVHTGQHYDDNMSNAFFESLNIPDADINLEVGSGSHAEQVGNTMIKLEKVLEKAAQLSIEQIIKDNQIDGQTHSSLITHLSPTRPLSPSLHRLFAFSPSRSIAPSPFRPFVLSHLRCITLSLCFSVTSSLSLFVPLSTKQNDIILNKNE